MSNYIKNGLRDHKIADMHCDMLHYLYEISDGHPEKMGDIGCALPWLIKGGVGFQVMAVYAPTEPGSVEMAKNEISIYEEMTRKFDNILVPITTSMTEVPNLESGKVITALSIESAAGLCEEDEKLDLAFPRVDEILNAGHRIIYISLTHVEENRFGGGNDSKLGLKDDGKSLLEFMDGKQIAVDFSHTSEALANDIIEHIDKKNLNIPVMASHSNFRKLAPIVRNLPENISLEIIRRKGIIGMTFIRRMVGLDGPHLLKEHILHGLELGGENSLCIGADFFYTKNFDDQSRAPFYYEEHEHAGKIPEVFKSLSNDLNENQLKALSSGNAEKFLNKLWFSG
ncbi:MAG: membrane dipeptidase [candidate division Zixibacteria bacterium]